MSGRGWVGVGERGLGGSGDGVGGCIPGVWWGDTGAGLSDVQKVGSVNGRDTLVAFFF